MVHTKVRNHRERPLLWGQCLFGIVYSVLNVKTLEGGFNQEKALVEALSVIANLRMKLLEALVTTGHWWWT